MLYNEPEQDRHKIRVLIVAENGPFLKASVEFLRRRGGLIVVVALQEHEHALAKAQELRPHIILFDLNASGSTALTSISRLRETIRDVGIIVLSSFETEGYRRAVLAAGANELVLKTSFTTDLMPAVERIMQGGEFCR
jgi:DNA-binding NarL/FixJ family response regulator